VKLLFETFLISQQKIKNGIRIFIEDKLEDHVPEETIIHKLMTKYELTKEEAMEYIEKYRI
jgi:hypothetical protein